MAKSRGHLVLAQLITLSRVCASLAFTTVAFQPHLQLWAFTLFLYALLSDLIDGRFARHFHVTSKFGSALDASGDKYHTIVATIYLAALGISPAACALLLLRDLMTTSLRVVRVDDSTLIPSSRWVGGVSGMPIKLLTLVLLAAPELLHKKRSLIEALTWVFAIVTITVLLVSLWKERIRIWRALNE